MKKQFSNIASMFVTLSVLGCSGYLDEKPSSGLTIPAKVQEFRNLLDNMGVMNITNPLPQLSADEYFIKDEKIYDALNTLTEKNAYLWNRDVYGGELNFQGWNVPYSAIFYVNNVLSGLEKIKDDVADRQEWNAVYGSAFFYRAYAYFDLVRNFCEVYNESTADSRPGLPLKLDPGIDKLEQRSSLKDTYGRIISDLHSASTFLSETGRPVTHLNRPSKPAVFALFARLYLDMRHYELAEAYADSTLAIYNALIDYKAVDTESANPFMNLTSETLFYTTQANVYGFTTFPGLNNLQATIDTNLIKLYEPDDLRFSIFYTERSPGEFYIKKGYSTGYPFTGLATDEIFLIKAECAVRNGKVAEGIAVLNYLLENRYDTSFEPIVVTDREDALHTVLLERRKELVWRALRWQDMKRLNREGHNLSIERRLNGKRYILPPNDPKYVFPIPDDEIALSGIRQNER